MIDVIGIGSWDRSGSTIVAEVLGAAPKVVSVGELNNLWDRGVRHNRVCSCGARFDSCPFWSEVMAASFPGAAGARLLGQVVAAADDMTNHGMLLRRALRRTERRHQVYSEGLGRLYAGIAQVSGADVIVDSAKIPWHLDVVTGLAGVRHWFLHLIRDPRGVVFSHDKVLPYDPDRARPEMMARKGALFTTLGWAYRNLMMSGLWGNSERYMRILYEDFVADPAAVTGRILGPVGLAPPEFPTVDAVNLVSGHSVSGNPIRFSPGPATIRSDDAWVSALGSPTRLAVGAATWPLRVWYRRPAAHLATVPQEAT